MCRELLGLVLFIFDLPEKGTDVKRDTLRETKKDRKKCVCRSVLNSGILSKALN